MMILGVDAGNYRVKCCGEFGLMDFISAIGESREVNLKQTHGSDDMIFEYEGRKGFAGTLALYESEFCGSIMGDSKAHEDSRIRVLLAVHRYCTQNNINSNVFQIVVGQPIAKHSLKEKEYIKYLLKGKHTLTVNGIKRTFHISRVEVAAEGATSYWSNPKEGLVRIIDVGSGTVNYSSILEGRYIDKDSGTLNFGMNTNKSNDLHALSRGIATHTLKKWDKNDNVYLVGGVAEKLHPYVKEYYSNTNILYPIYNKQLVDPIYANAIAFYNIAVNVYE